MNNLQARTGFYAYAIDVVWDIVDFDKKVTQIVLKRSTRATEARNTKLIIKHLIIRNKNAGNTFWLGSKGYFRQRMGNNQMEGF